MDNDLIGRRFGRRHFLSLSAGGAAFALVACGNDDDTAAPVATPTSPPAADPTPTPEPTDDNANGNANDTVAQGSVLIGDVLDHALEPQGWSGEYGFVTFRLHTGVVDGEPAYFIRCDASDQGFATQEDFCTCR